MSEVNTTDSQHQALPDELSHLFAQLHPEDVELFYQGYQLWNIERDIATLQAQIEELQQLITHNAECMQSIQPSAIALSALAQLQAYGVSDIDLLDRMLERGEGWLDHTMQLLARCEQLDVIRGDYTQWCENALEGAYNWLDSMDEAGQRPETDEPFDENIEAALLLKLMSEEAETAGPGKADNTAAPTSESDQIKELPADQEIPAPLTPADEAEFERPAPISTIQMASDYPSEAMSEEGPGNQRDESRQGEYLDATLPADKERDAEEQSSPSFSLESEGIDLASHPTLPHDETELSSSQEQNETTELQSEGRAEPVPADETQDAPHAEEVYTSETQTIPAQLLEDSHEETSFVEVIAIPPDDTSQIVPSSEDQTDDSATLDNRPEEAPVASMETSGETPVLSEEILPANTEQDQQTGSTEEALLSLTTTVDLAHDGVEADSEEHSDQAEHIADTTGMTTQSQEDDQISSASTSSPQQDQQKIRAATEHQQPSQPAERQPHNLLARLIHKRRQR